MSPKLISALFVISLLVSICFAIPNEMNYQGKLTNDIGVGINDTLDMTFRIYDDPTAGTLLWTEAHADPNDVPIVKGLFDVVLGSITALDLGFDMDYWLEIEVDGDILDPRVKLLSSPYSYRAAIADSVVGGSAVGDTALWEVHVTEPLIFPKNNANVLFYDDGEDMTIYAENALSSGLGTSVIYGYANGSSTDPTSWNMDDMNSAVKGYMDMGENHSAGVAGFYDGWTYPSAAVLGAYYNGTDELGALGYYDGSYYIGVYGQQGEYGDYAGWFAGNFHLEPQPEPLSPVHGDIYADDATNKAYFYNGSGWVDMTAVGGGGGTLDDAYDYGGPGVGRIVTVDADPVQLNGDSSHVAFTTLRVNNISTGEPFGIVVSTHGEDPSAIVPGQGAAVHAIGGYYGINGITTNSDGAGCGVRGAVLGVPVPNSAGVEGRLLNTGDVGRLGYRDALGVDFAGYFEGDVEITGGLHDGVGFGALNEVLTADGAGGFSWQAPGASTGQWEDAGIYKRVVGNDPVRAYEVGETFGLRSHGGWMTFDSAAVAGGLMTEHFGALSWGQQLSGHPDGWWDAAVYGYVPSIEFFDAIYGVVEGSGYGVFGVYTGTDDYSGVRGFNANSLTNGRIATQAYGGEFDPGIYLIPGTANLAQEGAIYANSTDHNLYFHDGTGWVDLTSGGGAGLWTDHAVDPYIFANNNPEVQVWDDGEDTTIIVWNDNLLGTALKATGGWVMDSYAYLATGKTLPGHPDGWSGAGVFAQSDFNTDAIYGYTPDQGTGVFGVAGSPLFGGVRAYNTNSLTQSWLATGDYAGEFDGGLYVIPNTAPLAQEGAIYANSTDNNLYFHDGSGWVDLTAVGAGVGGSGTVDWIPLWTPDGNTLGNSGISRVSAWSGYYSLVSSITGSYPTRPGNLSVYADTTAEDFAIWASNFLGSSTDGSGWTHDNIGGGGTFSMNTESAKYYAGLIGYNWSTADTTTAIIGIDNDSGNFGALAYRTDSRAWAGYFSGDVLINSDEDTTTNDYIYFGNNNHYLVWVPYTSTFVFTNHVGPDWNKQFDLGSSSYSWRDVYARKFVADSIELGGVTRGEWPSGGGVGGSGTLNYIPKWTPDGSTLGNSIIEDNGTTIKVRGTGTSLTTSQAGTIIGHNADGLLQGTDDSHIALNLHHDLDAAGEGVALGFGVSTLDEAIGAKIALERTGSFSAGDLVFFTKEDGAGNQDQTEERMRILSTGEVGINTSTPAALLELQQPDGAMAAFGVKGGTGEFDSSLVGVYDYLGFLVHTRVESGYPNMVSLVATGNVADNYGSLMRFYTRDYGDRPSERMRIDQEGNVGIGVTTPTAKLDVLGDVYIDGKLTVTGLVDPTGFGYTPQAVNPLPVGMPGTWVDDILNELHYYDGTADVVISGGGGVGGSGTANYIPLWTPDGSTLGDSRIRQTATQLQVNGSGSMQSNLLVYCDETSDKNAIFGGNLYGANVAGTAWNHDNFGAGVYGLNEQSTAYHAGVVGSNYGDYGDHTAGVVGSNNTGSIYGALFYELGGAQYAGYFNGDVHIDGDLTSDGAGLPGAGFAAYASSATSGSATDSVSFDTEQYDDASAYDPVTSIYTAPTDGLYHFNAHARMTSMTDGEYIWIGFQVNGSLARDVTSQTSANVFGLHISSDLKLYAGDEVRVVIFYGSSWTTVVGEVNTWFNGHKVY